MEGNIRGRSPSYSEQAWRQTALYKTARKGPWRPVVNFMKAIVRANL